MPQSSVKSFTIPALLAGLLMAVIPMIEDAHAKCQWVWRGAQSYLECDEDTSRRGREHICDKTTSRDRKGVPISITTFCRPDGSIWKKIVVKPHKVVVKVFRHDGSLAWKKQYAGAAHEEILPDRGRPHVPPLPSRQARVQYRGYFERHGDSGFVTQANILGRPGRRERLEGFSIDITQNSEPIELRYMAHVSRMGDTDWVGIGEFCGTQGQGRAVEGIAIDRVGKRWKRRFDVFYRAHVQRRGWTDWCVNGEFCGARGKGLAVNAMQMFIADR